MRFMNTINHTVKISLQMNALFLGKQGRDRLPANSVGNTGQAKSFNFLNSIQHLCPFILYLMPIWLDDLELQDSFSVIEQIHV